MAQQDSDGDGVSNEIDQCPETPGDGEFGCPVEPVDSDGDGVMMQMMSVRIHPATVNSVARMPMATD